MSNEKLNDVVDAIINDEHEQAEVAFHTYLTDKMRKFVTPDFQEVRDGQKAAPVEAPVEAPAAEK
jgi:hypothetical protein